MTDPPRGFLAIPSPGDRTMARLTRKLRLLVLQHLLTAQARSLAPPLSGAVTRLQSHLRALAADKKRAPGLLTALGRVDVMTPLLCAMSDQLPLDAALRRAVPPLLIQLGASARPSVTREQLLWDVPVERLESPSAGHDFNPPAQGLLVDGPSAQLRDAEGQDQPWPPADEPAQFHPILGGPQLALTDPNPLAMLEAHPDKLGNAIDLGGREPQAWTSALEEALALLRNALPDLHAELVAHLQRVVPVGHDPERHFSASYREAPGQVYLSLHPSPLTLAEALVHETQHGKLNTLRWFDPVLHNGDREWTTSPVRPDLRPLMGVLLGVHAFVPVAALHRALEDLDHPICETAHFRRRRQEVTEGNEEGLSTLRRLAEPSELGARVLASLESTQMALKNAPNGSSPPSGAA